MPNKQVDEASGFANKLTAAGGFYRESDFKERFLDAKDPDGQIC